MSTPPTPRELYARRELARGRTARDSDDPVIHATRGETNRRGSRWRALCGAALIRAYGPAFDPREERSCARCAEKARRSVREERSSIRAYDERERDPQGGPPSRR